jgi:serine/threonine protein kinase
MVPVRRHQVAREVRLHISLLHEHIIKLYAAFEDAEHVVLVQVSRVWQAGGY